MYLKEIRCINKVTIPYHTIPYHTMPYWRIEILHAPLKTLRICFDEMWGFPTWLNPFFPRPVHLVLLIRNTTADTKSLLEM